MIVSQYDFIIESKKALTDNSLQERIAIHQKKYLHNFQRSAVQFSNLELARKRAAHKRWKVINNLDKYLIEFESNFIKKGGKIIWAQDIGDVLSEINAIIQQNTIKSVLKNGDDLTDELGLDIALEQQHVDVIENDYGRFILQSTAEIASHSVFPNLQKNFEEIKQFLKKQIGIKDNQSTTEAGALIRNYFRNDLAGSEAGIVSARFVVADPGVVVISDNEGGAVLTASASKKLIVLVPVDQVVHHLSDLDLMMPLHATYANGVPLQTYYTLLSGPRQQGETTGPEELYIILIDNGRTELLAHELQRQVSSCIRCGACEQNSAIYKTIGGKVYPGPVKSISAPLSYGTEKLKYLADLTTMDGSGSEACPVLINFPKLVLQNRKYFIEKGLISRNDKWFFYAWKKVMLKRERLRWTGIDARKKIMEAWIKSREGLRTMPVSSSKTFNQQWRERMGYK